MKLAKSIALSLFTTVSVSTHAVQFRNLYLGFELPDNWLCKSNGYEFTCENTVTNSREALIVLTAQETKPNETLKGIRSYLKKSKTRLSPLTEKAVQSKVLSVRTTTIANQKWVEAIHENSELDGYTTRYLATAKNGFTIFFSFSVKQELLPKYKMEIERSMATLRQSDLTSSKFNRAVDLYAAAKKDYLQRKFYECGEELEKVHAVFDEYQDSKELADLCETRASGSAKFQAAPSLKQSMSAYEEHSERAKFLEDFRKKALSEGYEVEVDSNFKVTKVTKVKRKPADNGSK
jgi:hypothetical protein